MEILAPAGTNLTGWSIQLYNGADGKRYATLALAGSVADPFGGHGSVQVDAAERLRNDAVQSYQGNRNPFVDDPEWVACLYQNNRQQAARAESRQRRLPAPAVGRSATIAARQQNAQDGGIGERCRGTSCRQHDDCVRGQPTWPLFARRPLSRDLDPRQRPRTPDLHRPS